MNATRGIAPLLFIATLLVGCSDDPAEPNGLTLADLVGSWIATSDTHTNNANAAETFDIVANGGQVRTTVLATGSARTWVEFGTFMDEWDSALSLNGNTLTSDPVEAGRPTRTWTISLVDDVVTMTDANAEFDFTLMDAPPVSTTEVVVFVRN